MYEVYRVLKDPHDFKLEVSSKGVTSTLSLDPTCFIKYRVGDLISKFRILLDLDQSTVLKYFNIAFKNSFLSHELYEQLSKQFDDSCQIAIFLAQQSYLWCLYGLRDIPLLPHYLNDSQVTKLMKLWHSLYNLRRLESCGLKSSDLGRYPRNFVTVYRQAFLTPYLCPSISIIPSERNREGANLIRNLNQALEKGITYLPLNDLEPIEILDKYPVALVDENIQLEEAARAESTVAKRITDLLVNGNEPWEANQDDQVTAINCVLHSRISIITGRAGTGKTTIIRKLLKAYKERGETAMVTSFTGKAVSRLRSVLQLASPSTLHWLISHSGEVPPFDHLIVDETSMVTTALFGEFLISFPGNFTITLFGDPFQLEPVGWGSLFDQLLKIPEIPHVQLTTQHRSNVSGINLNTNRVLKGIPELIPGDGFNVIEGQLIDVGRVLMKYRSMGIPVEHITIVTPENKYLDQLNLLAQKIYDLDYPSIRDLYDRSWRIRDRVILTENRYEIGVMNGEEGIITDIEEDSVVVTFASGIKTRFFLRDHELTIRLLQHSYALTVHLSQGSEWNYVIYYHPEDCKEFVTSRLLYTALTRPRKEITVIGSVEKIQASIKRTSSERDDLLSIYLKKYLSYQKCQRT